MAHPKATGWADYSFEVPAGHQYIALDRLKYGFSEIPSTPLSRLNGRHRQIAPFLETKNGRKTILVGHSSGASIVLQTARDNPNRVGGMLLLAGAFDPEFEEVIWLQQIGTLLPVSRLLSRAINNANHELLS